MEFVETGARDPVLASLPCEFKGSRYGKNGPRSPEILFFATRCRKQVSRCFLKTFYFNDLQFQCRFSGRRGRRFKSCRSDSFKPCETKLFRRVFSCAAERSEGHRDARKPLRWNEITVLVAILFATVRATASRKVRADSVQTGFLS